MSRKRLEYVTSTLRDLGLAAVIGGVGDLVINAAPGRIAVDIWGIACGVPLLIVGVYASGLEARR